jgi:1-acyl-sn-glycerol-3-phosphate acyltransferase
VSGGQRFGTWQQKLVIVPLVRAMKLWHRPRVHGLEQVPPDRPVVYVGKHPRTWLYVETMLMSLLTFYDARRVRPFHAAEKQGTSLHRLPLAAWVRRHTGAIPATEEAALATLRSGDSVLLFPGGARELYGPPDRLGWRGRRGFARIAARAGVPVVPFAIAGADQQHPLRLRLGRSGSLWLPPLPLPVPLDFWFGAPLDPPPEGDAAAIAGFADRVADATQALLAEASRLRRPPWSVAR